MTNEQAWNYAIGIVQLDGISLKDLKVTTGLVGRYDI